MLYTIKSSSDPRGRLRGGDFGWFGEAVAADAGGGAVKGAAACGAARTRARRMFTGRESWVLEGTGAGATEPAGAVARAIPTNVAGDNIPRGLCREG